MAPRPTRPRLMAAIAGVTMPLVMPRAESRAMKTNADDGANAKMIPRTLQSSQCRSRRAHCHGTQSTIAPPGESGDQTSVVPADRAGARPGLWPSRDPPNKKRRKRQSRSEYPREKNSSRSRPWRLSFEMEPRSTLRASRKCANPVKIAHPGRFQLQPINSPTRRRCAPSRKRSRQRARRSPKGARGLETQGVPTGRPDAELRGRACHDRLSRPPINAAAEGRFRGMAEISADRRHRMF